VTRTAREASCDAARTQGSASSAASDEGRLCPGLASDDREVPWIEERGSVAGPREELARGPRKKGSGQAGSRRSKKSTGLLSEAELRDIEERYESGITAVEAVEIFTSRDVRLSEATFRKYVQQGLLPRSRRIGRKGKHRGSMGVYPAKTVRRINTIKERMDEGYTIEEIQEHFLRFADLVESVDEGLSELFDSFEEAIEGPRYDARTKKGLTRDLAEAKRIAEELMQRVGGLAETVGEPPKDRYRTAGAAGSAEDLL